ncbi:MAG: division/cell wall cluster transcriptional repressor MraZ [Oscillospiraceae bacterium]|nr:division/cell wall cluster transcriptional repressor MraZ [Oscillospiraceae bacterium]
MLIGEYRYSVDVKGRLFIPAKLREEMGNELILSKSVDKCINVYSRQQWESYCSKIKQLPEIKAREVKRFLFSTAQECEADSQGRAAISAGLREYAGLVKDVVIIGVDDRLEIWDAAKYDALNAGYNNAELVGILTECGF